ncbi:hypothetical protein H4219_003530 [Mycoemilia scoparia]|uniref:Uncharacterized protein n=1 Tax=Mycoemilia scoparia TaxID=417184 RepID=A0A9W8A093_9FUNG|nr:hypothetical protein H4219_003530 [Mycoemilia scoparia]
MSSYKIEDTNDDTLPLSERYKLGLECYQKKEYKAAIKHFTKIIKKAGPGKDMMAVLEARAQTYYLDCQYDNAFSDAHAAIQLNTTSARVYLTAAASMGKMKMYGPAMSYCKSGLIYCEESNHYTVRSKLESIKVSDCATLGMGTTFFGQLSERPRPLLKRINFSHLADVKPSDFKLIFLRLNQMRNLTSLHFRYCPSVTKKVLSSIDFSLMKNLESVDLSGCMVDRVESGGVALINIWRANSHEIQLKELICDDHPETLFYLWPQLNTPYGSQIRSLKLRCCELPNQAMRVQPPWSLNNQHHNRRIPAETLPITWSAFPQLEHLYLDGIATEKTLMTDFTHFDDVYFEPLPSSLKSLSLNNAFALLDQALVDWTLNTWSLTYLDLSGTRRLTDQAAIHLIPRSRNLETLVLDECISLSPQMLSQWVQACLSLRVLDLSRTMADNRTLKSLKHSLAGIHTLLLNNTRVTGSGVLQLVMAKVEDQKPNQENFGLDASTRSNTVSGANVGSQGHSMSSTKTRIGGGYINFYQPLKELSLNNCDKVERDALDRIRVVLKPHRTTISYHFK